MKGFRTPPADKRKKDESPKIERPKEVTVLDWAFGAVGDPDMLRIVRLCILTALVLLAASIACGYFLGWAALLVEAASLAFGVAIALLLLSAKKAGLKAIFGKDFSTEDGHREIEQWIADIIKRTGGFRGDPQDTLRRLDGLLETARNYRTLLSALNTSSHDEAKTRLESWRCNSRDLGLLIELLHSADYAAAKVRITALLESDQVKLPELTRQNRELTTDRNRLQGELDLVPGRIRALETAARDADALTAELRRTHDALVLQRNGEIAEHARVVQRLNGELETIGKDRDEQLRLLGVAQAEVSKLALRIEPKELQTAQTALREAGELAESRGRDLTAAREETQRALVRVRLLESVVDDACFQIRDAHSRLVRTLQTDMYFLERSPAAFSSYRRLIQRIRADVAVLSRPFEAVCRLHAADRLDLLVPFLSTFTAGTQLAQAFEGVNWDTFYPEYSSVDEPDSYYDPNAVLSGEAVKH